MRIGVKLLSSAGVLGALLALSTGVAAQDYGSYGGYGPANEQIIVNGPRVLHQEHSPLNTPIEGVSLSVPVQYADLDLRTRWGAHELKARIESAAFNVCRELRYQYPASLNPDSFCYKNAVAEAMPQADTAVQTARGEWGRY